MTTGSLIGMSSVKPCCRILICCRSSSILGSHLIIDCPSYASRPGPNHRRRYDYCYTQKIVGNRCRNDADRRAFCSPGCNGNHVRVFRSFYCSGNVSSGRSSIITHVASDVRNHSTSTASSSSETQVDEKRFERFYLHGGLHVNVNMKPLVIEGIEDYTELGVEQIEKSIGVYTNDIQELGNIETSPSKRKLSAIEEAAWKLLRSAVVNYCGKPIGTVAANDTADKQQLNYDQVFVWDFIPSAIAFLFNGEGKIVKNFLLQTLQLQPLVIS